LRRFVLRVTGAAPVSRFEWALASTSFPAAWALMLYFPLGTSVVWAASLYLGLFFVGLVITTLIVAFNAARQEIPRADIGLMFYFSAMYLVAAILAYANIYRELGLTEDKVTVTDVRDFVYFSIVTWTTVGYGDLVPARASRLFAASEGLFGYISMALFLALIFHVISARMPKDDGRGGTTEITG
jgi:Ion channel